MILLQGGEGEIIEKKSRFIATVRPVENEQEASAFINEMKKKYWDARHNCSAFVIGKNNEIMRSSDDGEPSGTAGRPILEILTKSGVHNAAIVVTRYFGGVLLGTGGLIRAYSQAAKEGLANSEIGVLAEGKNLRLEFGYNEVGKVQNYLRDIGQPEGETNYLENVTMILQVENALCQKLTEDLIELSAGKIQITEDGDCTFLKKCKTFTNEPL